MTLDAVEATALLGDEAANTWRVWTESFVWAVTIGTTATATSVSLMTGRGKKRSGILIRPLLLYISKTIFDQHPLTLKSGECCPNKEQNIGYGRVLKNSCVDSTREMR